MNPTFWDQESESNLATRVRRPATVVAALFAVIAVILSVLAVKPSALAEPEPTGSLLIKTNLQGLSPDDLAQIDSISATYRCGPAGQSPENFEEVILRLHPNVDAEEFPDIPVGYECHVFHNSGIPVNGYTVDSTKSPADGKVTIKQGQGENDSNLVTITHTYEPNTTPNPIFAKKAIAGDRPTDLNDDTEFTVRYQCDKDSADGTVKANTPTEMTLKAKGDPVTGPEFPTGTKCKVVEEKQDDVPKFDGYSFTADLGKEITVTGDAAASTLVVTNTFKYEGPTGSLLIKKKVRGLDDLTLIDDAVLVDYKCVPAGQSPWNGVWQSVNVPTNGEAQEIKGVPVGYTCHVKEHANQAQVDGYSLYIVDYSPKIFSGQSIVTIEEGQGKNGSNLATITNNYLPNTAPIFEKSIIASWFPAGLNDDTEFTIKYECDSDSVDGTVQAHQPTEVKLKAKGEPVAGPRFPKGTKCKVVEETIDEPKFEGYSITADLGKEITITDDFNNNFIEVTNTFEYVGPTGSLLIKNLVQGLPDMGLIGDSVRVDFACVAAGQPLETVLWPAVNLPVNGEVQEFPGFPVGYECHVIEDIVDVAGYDLDVTYSPEGPYGIGMVTIKEGQGVNNSNLVTIRNKYEPNTLGLARIFFEKTIDGERPVNLKPGTEFTVKYQCNKDSADGTVKANAPTEMTLKARHLAVAGPKFPLGTKCEIVEENLDEPKFEGYSFTADLGSEITVSDNRWDNTLWVTNTFRKKDDGEDEAKLRVTKSVTGVADTAVDGKDFEFNYTCGADTGVLKLTGKGSVQTEKTFPIGTECTVTENKASVNIPGYEFVTPDDQLTKTVTVSKGAAAVAEFVNTYKPRANKFTVQKTVQITGDAAAPATFDFDYKCELDGDTITGEILRVPANGSGESAEIPPNYVCTVTERDATVAGTTLVTNIGDGVTISDKGPLPVINVSNVYIVDDGTTVGKTDDRPWWLALIPVAVLSGGGSNDGASSAGTNPNTAQPTTPQEGAQAKSTNAPITLARTGASVFGVVALAGIAIAAGIVLVRRGRNKN